MVETNKQMTSDAQWVDPSFDEPVGTYLVIKNRDRLPASLVCFIVLNGFQKMIMPGLLNFCWPSI